LSQRHILIGILITAGIFGGRSLFAQVIEAPLAHERAAASAAELSPSAPAGDHPARMKITMACVPGMPASAQRAGASGTSHLSFTIDAQGKVVASSIVSPSGHSAEHHLLDRAALEALGRCPVEAGTDATGQPTTTTIRVAYKWVYE
jgi:TonB family protein